MLSATDETGYGYAMNGHDRNDITAISVADTINSTRDYKFIGVVVFLGKILSACL